MPVKTWSETKEAWNKMIRKWPERSLWKNIRVFINIIDDPIDWVKEKLHGMRLPFGYELNISFLMANRDTTWDIIRPYGDYPNSDPEDLEG